MGTRAMTEQQIERLRSRLELIARDLRGLDLADFARAARERARGLKGCANSREQGCRLERLADFAEDLADAEAELAAERKSA